MYKQAVRPIQGSFYRVHLYKKAFRPKVPHVILVLPARSDNLLLSQASFVVSLFGILSGVSIYRLFQLYTHLQMKSKRQAFSAQMSIQRNKASAIIYTIGNVIYSQRYSEINFLDILRNCIMRMNTVFLTLQNYSKSPRERYMPSPGKEIWSPKIYLYSNTVCFINQSNNKLTH